MKTDGDDALIETGRIFVRNLSYLCQQEDLEALFTSFGPVVETHLPLDMNTKRPKGKKLKKERHYNMMKWPFK